MLHKLDKHSQEQAEGQETTTQLVRLKHDRAHLLQQEAQPVIFR